MRGCCGRGSEDGHITAIYEVYHYCGSRLYIMRHQRRMQGSGSLKVKCVGAWKICDEDNWQSTNVPTTDHGDEAEALASRTMRSRLVFCESRSHYVAKCCCSIAGGRASMHQFAPLSL